MVKKQVILNKKLKTITQKKFFLSKNLKFMLPSVKNVTKIMLERQLGPFYIDLALIEIVGKVWSPFNLQSVRPKITFR